MGAVGRDRASIAGASGIVVLATATTLLVTHLLLGAAGADLALMALTLLATGMVGVAVAAIAPRWFGRFAKSFQAERLAEFVQSRSILIVTPTRKA